jgi:hypothetical protein
LLPNPLGHHANCPSAFLFLLLTFPSINYHFPHHQITIISPAPPSFTQQTAPNNRKTITIMFPFYFSNFSFSLPSLRDIIAGKRRMKEKEVKRK